ncbi:MAG: hypothetical protein ACO3ZY_12935 [Phycisphaerales bacterium]
MREPGNASTRSCARFARHGGWAVVAIAAMALGGFTYILYRPKSLAMFGWFESLGLDPVVESLRRQADSWAWRPPAWWIGSAPAALWLLSGLCAFTAIWRSCDPRGARLWLAAVVIAGLGGEAGQAIGFVPGTFDAIDLGASLLAIAFFVWMTLPRDRAAILEPST